MNNGKSEMTEKRKDIVFRFGIVYVGMLFLFVLIVYKMIQIQVFERQDWMKLADKQKISNIAVKPKRGNVFATDGRMIASSIPTYYVYMDMRVPALTENNGALFKEKVDSLSKGLSQFFGDKSAREYKEMLQKGFREKRGELRLYPKRISYARLKDLKKLPLFNLGRNKSGLLTKEYVRRVKPFGSLAARTIGDVFADEEKGGKNGLENYFDAQLRGTPGVATRQKVANRYRETIEIEPIDGNDIVTTIDIDLQDITEKALLDTVSSLGAASGYAILMEVKTGEIKAIVNLQRNEDGTYSENVNGAVRDELEPGSTFKVASLMAVLDESDIKITDTIDTGNGIEMIGGRPMKDHNFHRGGYHHLSVAEVIHGSSNIGISKLVRRVFGAHPEEFVNKLYEMKLNAPLPLQLNNTGRVKIKHPKKDRDKWYNTSLSWMSIGYETEIPPIYTLTFFNAIANDGKMISPLFVKSVMKNGQVLQTFEAQVINEAICKPSTLKDVREVLLGVVEGKKGTAKNVKSDLFHIAGKTGTAQISQGLAGYKGQKTRHRVSFCGYFPADKPQYTCLVVVTQPNGMPSGGKMAGSVVKNIAEQTMLFKSSRTPADVPADTLHHLPWFPDTKNGSVRATSFAMNKLNLQSAVPAKGWMKAELKGKQIQSKPINIVGGKVPDVTGMGAKDAFYLLGELGLNVRLEGRGKVISQNLKPGTGIKKGNVIILTLN